MRLTSQPISTLIPQRFSCRKYQEQSIPEDLQHRLLAYLSQIPTGPFGNAARFSLVAASSANTQSLRGLGTYGFIRGATGFIIGAISPGEKYLEDYGYLMETIVLLATDLRLGTCWLGGTFTQSSFARKIDLRGQESTPAVISIGRFADEVRARNSNLRQHLGANHRKPWSELFFQSDFNHPLDNEAAHRVNSYTTPLEMVRLAPSASNKQPWRIVQDGNAGSQNHSRNKDHAWHFYLQRTRNYGRDSLTYRILQLADLQRVDMGIAMCHFELTARELGLPGMWKVDDPGIGKPNSLTEYVATWIPEI